MTNNVKSCKKSMEGRVFTTNMGRLELLGEHQLEKTPCTMMMLLQVGPGDNYTLTVRGFNDALSTLGDSMTQYGSSFSGGEVHNQV